MPPAVSTFLRPPQLNKVLQAEEAG
jgi:hypothetical protein